MKRIAVLAMAAVTLVPACGEGDRPTASDPATIRDSVGVRIVENAASDPAVRLAWTVGTAPRVTIGRLDGDPRYELFGVEDALRLADGRLLVANSGTSEVRVYDSLGVYESSWGRAGEGPGEFSGLSALARWAGDSVMAWDFSQNRLTVFDRWGGVGRTRSLMLGEGRGAARYEGVLGDGSLVTASLVSFRPEDRTTGLVRRSRVFTRIDRDGALLAELGEHPDEEYYVRPEVGAILRHPFRRSVHSVVWNDRIVISPNDRYEIRAYEADGSLGLVVRLRHPVRAVTQADVDAYVERRLAEATEEERPVLARVFEGIPPVESYPAFSALVVDASGDLWVKEYEPGREEGRRWTVFARDGRLRGLIETPPGLTVYRIGMDYILGGSTDELGVEQVQLWSLDRSGALP